MSQRASDADHLAKLAAARLRAIDNAPFLAAAVLALQPVLVDDLDTFAVDDKWRLQAGRSALVEWSIEEVSWVLLHEVSHVVRDHHRRGRVAGSSQDGQRWNLAADAEINDDLFDMEAVLPGHYVTSWRLGLEPERPAEHYFAELQGISDIPALTCCGGFESPGTTEDDTIGVDEGEAWLLRQAVGQAIEDAVAAGHGIGEGWCRWAEATLRPSIDWRKQLRSQVRRGVAVSAGLVDYDYSRPSRRTFGNVIFPRLVQPVPMVDVIVDTSGSMTDGQVGTAWSELSSCVRSTGGRRGSVRSWAADDVIERVSWTGSPVMTRGGGGTDMAKAVQHVRKQRPSPDLIVVLTDGFTGWPDPGPDRVIAVIIESPFDVHVTVPDWINAVHIERAAVGGAN